MSIDILKHRVDVTILHDDEATNALDPVDPATLDGKTELEPIVDRDLDAFADFYVRKLANGSLGGYERAAIKTYIYWKTHPELK